MIKKNVDRLKEFNFDELTERLTMQGMKGEFVRYMTLMFDRDTGEILDIAKGLKLYDNMLTTPIAIKTRDLFETSAYHLEMLDSIGEEVSEELQKVIVESFEIYNQQ